MIPNRGFFPPSLLGLGRFDLFSCSFSSSCHVFFFVGSSGHSQDLLQLRVQGAVAGPPAHQEKGVAPPLRRDRRPLRPMLVCPSFPHLLACFPLLMVPLVSFRVGVFLLLDLMVCVPPSGLRFGLVPRSSCVGTCGKSAVSACFSSSLVVRTQNLCFIFSGKCSLVILCSCGWYLCAIVLSQNLESLSSRFSNWIFWSAI